MTETIKALTKEISERESSFQIKLRALGNADLASDFSDIITVRRTVEILKSKSLIGSTSDEKEVAFGNGNSTNKAVKSDFVLTDAVRGAMRSFNNSEFTVNDVIGYIKSTYPDVDIESRKASVSAVLVGMANMDEIERVQVGKGGTPTIYRNLFNSQVQPVLLEEAKNGSENVTVIT